jgi:hypothetical protein
MAHSLLNYILHDDSVEPLNIKPQQIVLGSLKNPILRALFSSHIQPDAFITEENDGSRIDLFRLSSEAKPEQLNYAATTIQSWFQDVNFEIARDSSYMVCELPERVLINRLTSRLNELDMASRRLKNKNGILLDVCEFNGFNSRDLLTEFLGNAFAQYNIPLTINDKTMEAC